MSEVLRKLSPTSAYNDAPTQPWHVKFYNKKSFLLKIIIIKFTNILSGLTISLKISFKCYCLKSIISRVAKWTDVPWSCWISHNLYKLWFLKPGISKSTAKANRTKCIWDIEFVSLSILRGESDGEDAPFRECFGKMSLVRFLINCLVQLINATAKKPARKKMEKKIAVVSCLEIIDNPDRTNIKHCVHKFKRTLSLEDFFFQWIDRFAKRKTRKLWTTYLILSIKYILQADFYFVQVCTWEFANFLLKSNRYNQTNY